MTLLSQMVSLDPVLEVPPSSIPQTPTSRRPPTVLPNFYSPKLAPGTMLVASVHGKTMSLRPQRDHEVKGALNPQHPRSRVMGKEKEKLKSLSGIQAMKRMHRSMRGIVLDLPGRNKSRLLFHLFVKNRQSRSTPCPKQRETSPLNRRRHSGGRTVGPSQSINHFLSDFFPTSIDLSASSHFPLAHAIVMTIKKASFYPLCPESRFIIPATP